MKKVFVLLIITQLLGKWMGIAQSLQPFYSETRCGLNYTQSSILLGKRMKAYGYPYYGVDQPAPFIISGIPESAKIEKAFIWWDIAGSDTIENVVLENPEEAADTFAGIRIGGNSSMCWGPEGAFRADVTSIILGNGTYFISGLPTDTTFDFFNKSDATGATLFIIYSDPANSYLGNLTINDGYLKIYNDTVFETAHFTPPPDTTTGKAFIILSDMQGEPGNAIKMNNGPFTVPSQDYWDFEQKNTVFVPSINYSIFGVRAPNDCIQLISIGIYFQEPIIPLSPVITRFGDVLTSSAGAGFQWYLNDSAITNAIFQNYLASQSGIYYVEVTDSFGCQFLSDTMTITICAEKIKPNIEYSAPDSLWTDSVSYSLQWFFNGNEIDDAELPYYIAEESGSYWVQAQDTTGCSVNSNIITVTIDGVSERQRFDSQFTVFPNPVTGIFTILNLYGAVYGLELFNIAGEKIYDEKKISEKSHRIKADFAKGVYFLKISGEENFTVKKVAVE